MFNVVVRAGYSVQQKKSAITIANTFLSNVQVECSRHHLFVREFFGIENGTHYTNKCLASEWIIHASCSHNIENEFDRDDSNRQLNGERNKGVYGGWRRVVCCISCDSEHTMVIYRWPDQNKSACLQTKRTTEWERARSPRPPTNTPF